MTVLETVLMGLTNTIGIFSSPSDADKQKAADILDSLGISHLAQRGCGQISGGERQLTLLARALIQDAKILIMDEPTANLDFGNSARVIAIKDGRVLTSGTPHDALTEETLSGLYRIGVLCSDIVRCGVNTRICVPGE